MSTLKATNIKNESSASNNIVLDSGGGAIFSGVTTFSSSVNFNSIGSLTLGTGTTIGAATSNTFIVSTNGSERIRVDSSGNLGIGTTNPQYTLDVAGDINLTGTFRQNGSQFVASRWTSGTGNDIYRLSGDVGIGTTNPQYSLDVVGDINFTGTFRQNGSQFVASRWTSGIGDDIYRLSGDVGIGTTNPTLPLHVRGATAARFDKGDTTQIAQVRLRTNQDSYATEWAIGQPANSLNFSIAYNNTSSWNEYLRIDSNGNVLINSTSATGTASQPLQVTGGAFFNGNIGIGTTNPQQALHVVGVVTATSYRGDGSQLSGISVGTDITSCLFT